MAKGCLSINQLKYNKCFTGMAINSANIVNQVKAYLTHFSPMFHFHTSWKRQKSFNFLTFSGGVEMEHWAKLDEDVSRILQVMPMLSWLLEIQRVLRFEGKLKTWFTKTWFPHIRKWCLAYRPDDLILRNTNNATERLNEYVKYVISVETKIVHLMRYCQL